MKKRKAKNRAKAENLQGDTSEKTGHLKNERMYIPQMTRFYQHIEKDKRITVNHISLYMALFQQWNLNGFKNPVSITRRQILQSAKMARVTYHKCMKDLNAFGYIKYVPSYHPVLGSQVYVDMFTFKTILPDDVT